MNTIRQYRALKLVHAKPRRVTRPGYFWIPYLALFVLGVLLAVR